MNQLPFFLLILVYATLEFWWLFRG